MNESWILTLTNDGKSSSIQGKTVAELMGCLTDKGLLLLQMKHDKKVKP